MNGNINDAAAASESAQYLTFNLCGEEYGIDILRVREIRGWSKVTRIPRAPDFVLGVLNLRGSIVPIMDLRRRFGLAQEEYTATTVTIVMSLGARDFGIVVDAVSDVLDVALADIKPVPDFGSAVDTEYLSGLAALDERMVMLLDAERLLNHAEWSALAATTADAVAEAA